MCVSVHLFIGTVRRFLENHGNSIEAVVFAVSDTEEVCIVYTHEPGLLGPLKGPIFLGCILQTIQPLNWDGVKASAPTFVVFPKGLTPRQAFGQYFL